MHLIALAAIYSIPFPPSSFTWGCCCLGTPDSTHSMVTTTSELRLSPPAPIALGARSSLGTWYFVSLVEEKAVPSWEAKRYGQACSDEREDTQWCLELCYQYRNNISIIAYAFQLTQIPWDVAIHTSLPRSCVAQGTLSEHAGADVAGADNAGSKSLWPAFAVTPHSERVFRLCTTRGATVSLKLRHFLSILIGLADAPIHGELGNYRHPEELLANAYLLELPPCILVVVVENAADNAGVTGRCLLGPSFAETARKHGSSRSPSIGGARTVARAAATLAEPVSARPGANDE